MYKHQIYRPYCLSHNLFQLFLLQVLFPMCRLLSRLSRIRSRLNSYCPFDNFHLMLLVIVIFPSLRRSYSLLYKHQRYRPYYL
ncbi:hypothetical protein OMAG_000965 [Candidatus Omnitrophus magneticus]|uniref:Uncharacterized protein n=1 Tax=Candidatus Omnitrophus magneticus TaxID=1609969 RepID=A0A0F0CPI1_9BACT|nr:hypothetical protein OMAG_000965 [Candidatus Omnitrophus magneticus]